jgi:hypothetical protein
MKKLTPLDVAFLVLVLLMWAGTVYGAWRTAAGSL